MIAVGTAGRPRLPREQIPPSAPPALVGLDVAGLGGRHDVIGSEGGGSPGVPVQPETERCPGRSSRMREQPGISTPSTCAVLM